MVETFMTKLFLSIAVIAIVTSLVGFFSLQLESFRLQELDATCDGIQLRVDEVSSVEGETRVLFTYGEVQAGEAVMLPHLVHGKGYFMDFCTTAILINQEDRWGRATFSHKVHLFYPGDVTDLTPTDLEALDGIFRTVRFRSENDFLAERRYFVSSGYQTFIYPSEGARDQSAVQRLADEIDQHSWSAPGTWEVDCDECDVVLLPDLVVTLGEGFAGVAQVHVNHTYDPDAVWAGVDGVDIEEFEQRGAASNSVIKVPKGGSFVMERYELSVEVRYQVVGRPEPEVRSLDIVHSFVHSGEGGA